MWKNIPKLATSCNLRVIAVKSLKSEIALTLTHLLLWLKLQEVANLGMFFHVMQTIYFIHVCVR